MKRIKPTNVLSILAICAIVLTNTACTTAIAYKKSPKTIKTELANVDVEAQDVAYMGRYRFERVDREIIENAIYQTETRRQRTTSMSTGVGMAGSALMGNNLLSNSGVSTAGTISLGIDALFLAERMLKDDGDLGRVSKFYLPATIDNNPITTPEQAGRVAIRYTLERIALFADKTGRAVHCYYGCGRSPGQGLILLKLIKIGMTGDEFYDHNSKSYPEGEYYDPPTLFVSLETTRFDYMGGDLPSERILGFKPTWASSLQNGWIVGLFGEPWTLENGELSLVTVKRFGEVLNGKIYNQTATALGRTFYRTLTGGSNRIVYGDDPFAAPSFLAMKGIYYNFRPSSARFYAVERVEKQTDAPYWEWLSNKDRLQTASTKQPSLIDSIKEQLKNNL